jgi:hypothetical protein
MDRERRTSPRIPVDIPLLIRRTDAGEVPGTVVDINLDGVCISPPQGERLMPGEIIEASLSLYNQHWVISALILHKKGDCYGALFADPQPDLYGLVMATHETEISLSAGNLGLPETILPLAEMASPP